MAHGPGGSRHSGIEGGGIGGLPGHIHIADALAGKAQGFGIGVTHHRIGINIGNPGSGHAAIGQFPVRLVGDDVDGPAEFRRLFPQQICQLFQRLFGIHHARGVVGGIEDDGRRVGGEHGLHRVQFDLKIRYIRGNDLEDRPCILHERLVLREVGRHGQNFRSRYRQRPEYSGQSRSRTAGDKQVLRSGEGVIAGV